MTRYKSFGAFLNRYTGSSRVINDLRCEFLRAVKAQPRAAQPWEWQTPAEVHALVKDRYPERNELALQMLHAKQAYLGPEHEWQVKPNCGYHSRKPHTWAR